MSFDVVYAIIKAGGRQEKVSVGDELLVEKVERAAGETIELPAILVVDGDKVTSKAADVAKVKVSAKVLGPAKGPKISIVKFKNKTGYRKRQGHRQPLTRLEITGIK
ncbi:50S ribosomal protein L21 [Mobiluncus mulieris]|uniref:Large ribosomal subunit protein bL21 n=2 Tax=Mobiluncus mulieris TaxID=2052 RepID=E0QQ44_9ACTO|nr:50S ribosomal protein L21 [Mobiluncus mulieris]EEJ54801.1 ribosomal protein L21 [Mobiluncus mulieris ATCC 35243]EEZ91875.1 ribosomal protein L21 [Mobiluncus mulieris 28-1]EFM46424.1 ribosomal protein L21 [Mobiluncus mulieris ATCC 35239]EFN92288.1 ribosomal protein L21 [Mobiluncus mulieris FB024-16]MBB5846589.1 large subunit ribosomal protein L21 [Mobiluncus mulieris]